ncbi:MAG: ABC transporter ATP-binding protein [Lentisphaerae bacterium]|nr:ABC transporter ATP-binding protein [Lentisphaerota bacterium]
MSIEISNLVRHFGKVKAVNGVSFSFGMGEVVGFVGPNGAGKTTTLRILATLDEPTAGDVLIDGVSVSDFPEAGRRQIGYMPDALPEHADMTAHEYVDFFGRAFGFRGAALRDAVGEVEAFTGLEPIRDKTLKSLSKGMKQRVSLARALVHRPSLLVMDEPANGLDPRARIELRELVRAFAESGKAVLISSHILSELGEMCSSVVIIERGVLVGNGTVATLAGGGQPTQRVLVRALAPAPEALARILLEIPGVTAAQVRGDRCAAETAAGGEAAADILAALIQRGVRVAEFRQEQIGLEDVFMQVTRGDLA